jgi:NADPH:quinone reductase-like Zn-dependent oxidoreductase
MQTKAFLLVKNGRAKDAFSLETIQLPKMEDDDITIEVSAFGLNYADVMARNGLYRECPPLPTTIGYEVVGKIISVGDEKNNHLLEKKVVAFTRFGGYAQHVITKSYAIAEIGDYDENKALCLATQYVTAYYMSHYVTNIHENENVLVHAAAGGVGTALIQLLKSKNVRIIAKTGSDKKINYLKDLGVNEIINYNKEDYTLACKRLLKNERLDVSFNPVAGSTFKKDMKLLGSGGRMILFGGSERSGKRFGFLSTLNFVWNMGLVIPIGLMMRSKNILGINMLKIADNKPEVIGICLHACLKLALEQKIDPQVGAVYENANLVDAHDFLESGKSTGKIVVKW